MKEKLICNWSGGKDAALCLYKLLESDNYEVVSLLTNIREADQRIPLHGIRKELFLAQHKSIGLPLQIVEIPRNSSPTDYAARIRKALVDFKAKGVTASAFGDIFLEDLRHERESKLAQLDLKGIFPLWQIASRELMLEFIELGFKAVTCCIDEKYLDRSFLGRLIDRQFLEDSPDSVDPCGENGEYHSFVYDGPIFNRPVPFRKGEVTYQRFSDTTGYWYCDLLPGDQMDTYPR